MAINFTAVIVDVLGWKWVLLVLRVKLGWWLGAWGFLVLVLTLALTCCNVGQDVLGLREGAVTSQSNGLVYGVSRSGGERQFRMGRKRGGGWVERSCRVGLRPCANRW